MIPTKTSVGPNEVVRLEVLRLAPPLRLRVLRCCSLSALPALLLLVLLLILVPELLLLLLLLLRTAAIAAFVKARM